MKSLQTYISERVVNLFNSDQDEREKYADVVYNLLQSSYKEIGGLKTSGFKSKDDMVKSIPFWKLIRKNDKIIAGAMYKDKLGRKRVAVFTDRTNEGKSALASIMKEDFSRAYFEVSGPSLRFLVKNLGEEFIADNAATLDKVRKLVKGEITDVSDTDPESSKYKILKKFMYQRDLGGSLKTKIMLGQSGNVIKDYNIKE